MQNSIKDGQILEFHGVCGDRIVLSSDPLSDREFLMARFASGNGPYPQDGKPWSTTQCLCLGQRRVETPRRSSYLSPKPAEESPESEVERCEMVFQEDGLILVEYPYRGHLHAAIIERIDRDGGRHTPDGQRKHWGETSGKWRMDDPSGLRRRVEIER